MARSGAGFRAGLIAGLLAATALAGCVPPPHAHVAAPPPPGLRVAVLPLSNYTTFRDAPDQLAPMLAVEVSRQWRARLIDRGAVDAILATEPWLLMDRLPPDLVDRLGNELGADALLIGSVLGYQYRDASGERIPHISIALRLLETPGGRLLWSAVHSRDGADGELVFGIGRVATLEQLAAETAREIIASLPVDVRRAGGHARSTPALTGEQQ